MNVRGERILIFGDSLSHHGSDNAPEIWDVDTGSARISGQPGDLLASMLAEQGAAAVRVNARVGRSAHNFWGREDTSSLLASDQAFAPTKVIVMLGTNDIGLNLDIDGAEMAQIRDFYKDLGAEVWGVGPFMYVSDTLNKQAMPVATMMRKTFGSRWIDPRDVTPLQGRAGDGVHFAPGSARELALALQQIMLTTSSPLPWKTIAIGVAMALGGALAYNYWKRGVVALPFGDLESDEYQPPEKRFLDFVANDDPEIDFETYREEAQDLLLQSGSRISQVTKTAGEVGPHTKAWFDLRIGEGRRLMWNVTAPSAGHCEARFLTSSGAGTGNAQWTTRFSGAGEWCERVAAADAWAIVRRLKQIEPEGPSRTWALKQSAMLADEMRQAVEQDNSEPEELYGLDESCNPNLSREAFVRCTKRQQRTALGVSADPQRTKLWRFAMPAGIWRVEKTVSTDEAEQWLKIFQKDEPKAAFKLSKVKPRKDPPHDTSKRDAYLALEREKQQILQALNYAGNTDEKVREYHAAIQKIDAKIHALDGLKGFDAARRRPEQETKTTEDGPGFSPPRQGELHIGRDNLSYKDLPWSKVIAEAKKEAKSESSNKLHLSMHVKHAPNDHTPFAHVSWDPMDQKGAIAFAKKLIDDKGAMYSSVVAFAERPHDRSDRRAPKGHWTLASFEDDSIPDDR